MKELLILIILLAEFQPAAWSQLSNTGWKSPTATHLPNGWTNPLNAFVSDDVYTTVVHGSGCRCPFVELSWDNGISYTSTQLFGPYGTIDSYRIQGDSVDTWGHSWIVPEMSDTNFVLRIWNPSTLIRQGYTAFQFGIPPGSIISGIEVQVEEHGDTAFTMEFIDLIQARVHYDVTTSVAGIISGKNEISIYPNPASSTLFIRNSLGGNYRVTLFNSTGTQVSNEKYFTDSGSIDVSNLAQGIYFLRAVNENDYYYLKFIKQ
jgi:hypothetical protein